MARRKRKAVLDEVSNDEVAPRAKPRPRKKQAVTKTNSAATKTLIRKNAATSPLLLLPSEIRENILIHLVGDNLIHVKYLDVYELSLAIREKKEPFDIGASEDGGSREKRHYFMFDTDDDDCNDGEDDDDDDDGAIAARVARLASSAAGRATPSVWEQASQPAFRHAICVANLSEQSAYEEAVSGHAVVPEGESPEFYVASCQERHATCNMCGSGPMFLREEDRQALRVDLNVLGVCRQLYEEANHLLWATNTFSFEDPKTLEKFLCSLNPAQKRKLTSIHISATIGGLGSYYYNSGYQRARWDTSYWGKALKMSNLNVIRGVQVLHLCINQGFECVFRGYGNTNDSAEQQIANTQQADLESILRLRALSVKHVTVIVSDDTTKLERDGKSAHRWTAIKKKEYAESIRVQLVDPSGAELVKKEAEAENLARKTVVRDNAVARVKSYKSILKNKQADVVRVALWASREEAKARLAAQKADQVSNKRSKKAARLQQDAERQKEHVNRARNAADGAVETEKTWQEQVANAREKYKRAMANLGATPEEIEDEEEAERLLEGSSSSNTDVGGVNVAQAHGIVQSDDDEPLASSPEEEDPDEDDEVSS
ncbi:hypothetical protein HO173_003894 [Letharia columbiana]|uniref:DUF7730 domain-containing protein n=1 Tax=Letharia columbiana TaxID=112416 RepID=A0A8H6FZI8_9LECA|nr:uncharacterized protein HO173_003894 [Letharia columbiana]KAF6237693.1 hypothetical protein HO173_003894 [Letharia columbiana]